MTSLFEPAPKVPPPPFLPDDRPCVWVRHDDGVWYDAVLWGWTWDPRKWTYWGYVDFYADRKHHLRLAHQDRIRRHQDGHPDE